MNLELSEAEAATPPLQAPLMKEISAFGLSLVTAQGKPTLPVIVAMLLILLTTILFFLWRKFSSKASTVLLVGLNGSGKTIIFTRLINREGAWNTYSSMQENLFVEYYTRNGTNLKLVDYPGAESHRKTLFQKWLAKGPQNLRCIIFVIDSITFTSKSKDVAEFLYDVFYETKMSVPVLVACNKQDVATAKSSQAISEVLEKEFGLINVSREAALSSTTGDSTKRLLSEHGSEFQWSEITRAVRNAFVECSAEEDENYNLDPIREWIDTI